jgi:phage protein D
MPINSTPVGYQSRLGTRYTVTFPDFPSYGLTPAQIELDQSIFHHDELTLTYLAVSNIALKGLKTGVPIKLTWRTSLGIKGEFVGYVTKVKRVKAGQVKQDVKVIACGASFPLKQTAANVWTNKTIPEVVKDIAKKTKMKSVVTQNSARYSQLSQHGLSYWEFLNELAHKAGYSLSVTGTTIHFLTMDDRVNKNMGTVPFMLFDMPFADTYHADVERTLDRFEPTSTDYNEDPTMATRRNKKITGVDPVSAKTYSTSKSPKSPKGVRKRQTEVLFDEQGSTQVVNSIHFAKSLANAKSEQARFTVPAKFFGQGDPRIKPYGMIDVSGIDQNSDGLWMVKSVTHSWSKTGKYTCEGVVLSDGQGATKPSNFRSAQSGTVPVLNLMDFNDGESLSLPKSPSLSVTNTKYSQSNVGYTVNPSKWT